MMRESEKGLPFNMDTETLTQQLLTMLVQQNYPLHAVVSMRDPNAVIIIAGLTKVDVNTKNLLGQTALHAAVAVAENQDVIKTLHRMGADLNARDASGFSPLAMLIKENDPKLLSNMRLLIELGADLTTSHSATIYFGGSTRVSLFDIAFVERNLDAVTLLLAKGAKIPVLHKNIAKNIPQDWPQLFTWVKETDRLVESYNKASEAGIDAHSFFPQQQKMLAYINGVLQDEKRQHEVERHNLRTLQQTIQTQSEKFLNQQLTQYNQSLQSLGLTLQLDKKNRSQCVLMCPAAYDQKRLNTILKKLEVPSQKLPQTTEEFVQITFDLAWIPSQEKLQNLAAWKKAIKKHASNAEKKKQKAQTPSSSPGDKDQERLTSSSLEAPDDISPANTIDIVTAVSTSPLAAANLVPLPENQQQEVSKQSEVVPEKASTSPMQAQEVIAQTVSSEPDKAKMALQIKKVENVSINTVKEKETQTKQLEHVKLLSDKPDTRVAKQQPKRAAPPSPGRPQWVQKNLPQAANTVAAPTVAMKQNDTKVQHPSLSENNAPKKEAFSESTYFQERYGIPSLPTPACKKDIVDTTITAKNKDSLSQITHLLDRDGFNAWEEICTAANKLSANFRLGLHEELQSQLDKNHPFLQLFDNPEQAKTLSSLPPDAARVTECWRSVTAPFLTSPIVRGRLG